MNDILSVLKQYWGYESFRPLQEDIIRSVMAGRDTLALMPTGGGKSITFQVPAMAMEGLCVVITPLIALMKDQTENLKKRRIKAVSIYSGLTAREIDTELNNCIYGGYKFLYVSPERLSSEMFLTRILQVKVNLLAVDEAHCISQWGHDFRPAYREIAALRELLPGVPVLALTATATPAVVEDIQCQLRFGKPNVLKTSFERKNLVYLVRHVEDKPRYLLQTISRFRGSGIIYVRNRKKTRETAQFLQRNGIDADYYHAGLSNEARSEKQDRWKEGLCRVIVSTNAFGMGIDKPDVRFVIHLDLPDTLEAYFQEAGRAGRDLERAYAVLLYEKADANKLQQRLRVSFPEPELIRRIYQALGNYLQVPLGGGRDIPLDFSPERFAETYRLELLSVHHALKLIEREGYIRYDEDPKSSAKVHFTVSRDDLYKFQVSSELFDDFIKLLLRSYTGFFSEYVSIDEAMLARNAKVSTDVIYEYLKKLDRMKIIDYVPRRKHSVITYTRERIDEKYLTVSTANYKVRKDVMQANMDAVMRYTALNRQCRSVMLLEYFGEHNALPCGQCDYCIANREREIVESLRQKIIDADENGQADAETIARELGVRVEKVIETLRHIKDGKNQSDK
ncbi:MAG: RecQ family ATP-dependent DNA helicase [Bacteroidales bacterium]|jgi:ATP-dependent DNA helicase RecQ|nr:RecQ family ATP-dependent DNA helicase [Bacteroidales bacterium]